LGEELMRELKLRSLDSFALGRLFVADGLGNAALEDVLFGFGNGFKDFRGDAEVFSQDGFWSMSKPVSEEEGRVFGEMTVIENEQELCSIWCQTLKRVRMASWEVPQVTLLEVTYKVATLLVEGGDSDFAFKNVGPFCLNVPMEFTDDTCIETHIDTC